MSEVDDNSKIRISSHIIIREKDSDKTLVDKSLVTPKIKEKVEKNYE